MAETPSNLGARTASGTMWFAGQTLISRFTSLASTVILARILLEQDYGRIGLVYTITAFAGQLTNLGIEDILLQKQKHIARWTTAAFWFSLAMSVAGAVVMVALAMVVVAIAQSRGSTAYGDPTLIKLIAVLAIASPLNAATIVPGTLLRSELRFAQNASIAFADVVLQQLLMVMFALMGAGTYSFVLPVPIAACVRLAVLWRVVRPKIHMRLSIHRWPSLTAAGAWVMGQRMLYTGTSQGDYMLLAGIYGDKTIIGVYFFAFTLSIQVLRLLCENTSSALAPALNAIRDDSSRMWNAVHRAAKALAVMVIPVASLQILLAGPVLRVLFAGKWNSAIPLVQWLSVGPLVYWGIWPMNVVMLVSGRFRDNFILWLGGLITFLAMVAPATYLWNSIGTAASVGAWSWLMAMYYSMFTFRSPRGFRELARWCLPPLAAAAAGAAPSSLIVWLLPAGRWTDIAAIVIVTPLFLTIFGAVLWRADPETAGHLWNHLANILRPLARRFLNRGFATTHANQGR